MFKKYTLIAKTMNLSDGEDLNFETKDTEKEIIDLFYDKCSQLGGNPQTKACEIIILDPNGDLIRIEKIDNSKYITE